MSVDLLIFAAMITVVALSTLYIVHALRGLVNHRKRIEAHHLQVARSIAVERKRGRQTGRK
jgi:hypothetical protein